MYYDKFKDLPMYGVPESPNSEKSSGCSSKTPNWFVIESLPIRELSNEPWIPNTRKKIGDIHSTVDINPDSESFGEAHFTMRIPGGEDLHF